MNERLSLKERISYGCGDFGLCLVTTTISVFLFYFYTEIAKISVLQVGTIMLIGGIADAISDPLMGVIIDKTNTRWGKCRPYLLFMSVPLAVAAFFVFNIPDASSEFKFMYAAVTYVIYNLAYTAVCIPYQTMMASITGNEEDRLSVNMWKTIGSSTSQFIINAFALSIVAAFGGGMNGYKLAITVLSIAGVVFLLTCFKNTKERIIVPKSVKVGFKDTLQAFCNVPWLIICFTALLSITAVIMRAQQTMYYAQYVMGDINMASKLLTISTVLAIPVAIVVPKLAVKFGKRNLVLFGSALYVIASCGMSLFHTNPMIVFAFAVFAGIGCAVPNSVSFVMTAEAIDYGEWKNGKRVQGALMSFVGFGVKVGISVASMIASLVLKTGGYVEGESIQSEAAVNAISMNFIWIPVIMFAIIFVLNLFYTLDKKYPQIKEELELRRTANAA